MKFKVWFALKVLVILLEARISVGNDQSRDKVIKKNPRRPSNAQNVLARNIYFHQPNLLHRSNWSHPNKTPSASSIGLTAQ